MVTRAFVTTKLSLRLAIFEENERLAPPAQAGAFACTMTTIVVPNDGKTNPQHPLLTLGGRIAAMDIKAYEITGGNVFAQAAFPTVGWNPHFCGTLDMFCWHILPQMRCWSS